MHTSAAPVFPLRSSFPAALATSLPLMLTTASAPVRPCYGTTAAKPGARAFLQGFYIVKLIVLFAKTARFLLT